ncbi:DCL family protein [Pseudogulbenkiania ferrooxidans]|uniref:DCL family protein n=1 Tax=Pseudogulbenkiania ferrooxidans TaxID=549169 RepID=UPI00137729D5|nr:DCL family protein [Pseudogulbenkiania ferrooxidans]
MAKPVYLDSEFDFRTKSDAYGFFKDILNSYDDGDFVSVEHHRLALIALLSNHPDAVQKIGVGVREFERNRAPDHRTSCFYVIRTDNSKTDFSYRTAVDGAAATQQVSLRNACHSAIEDKINAMRRAFLAGPNPCSQISGTRLYPESCHVLHKNPTFGMLISAFRVRMGWTDQIPEGVFTDSADLQSKTQFVDRQHAIEFNELHDKMANVLMVTAEESRVCWRG